MILLSINSDDGEQTNDMNASISCISCLIGKQEKLIRRFSDEEKKNAFFQDFLTVVQQEGLNRTAPWLQGKADRLLDKYFGTVVDYPALKSGYNQYLLSKEAVFEEKINASEDRLAECIKYVCAGNYIDTMALDEISDEILETLLNRVDSEEVDPAKLAALKADLSGARELVFITDNCGEIVLDKLFVRHVRKLYPELHVTVMVRGGLAANDATMEDAEEVGLTEETDCVGNGSSLMGTDLSDLSAEALALLKNADIIIAKGQGNFETLHGSGLNAWYLFLCKCEYFTRKFNLPQFTSVLIKETPDEERGA